MKVYVASSWRNLFQQSIVKTLLKEGHEVYDFRNSKTAFSWSVIDPEWRNWTPEKFDIALKHPVAVRGFNSDMEALKEADACVMVLPCGRSAHLELGYAVGIGKLTIILSSEIEMEPELAYKMVDHYIHSIEDVIEILRNKKCVQDKEKKPLCGSKHPWYPYQCEDELGHKGKHSYRADPTHIYTWERERGTKDYDLPTSEGTI